MTVAEVLILARMLNTAHAEMINNINNQ